MCNRYQVESIGTGLLDRKEIHGFKISKAALNSVLSIPKADDKRL